MPEVPSNMQDQLAHLELEARDSKGHRISSQSTSSSIPSPNYQQSFHTRESSLSSINTLQKPSAPGFTASYEHTNAAAYQNLNRMSLQRFGGGQDSPKFSPFPKLRDAGPNVPLSDDEKEEVLERARPVVLKSTDPEMQLAWAQDALTWVEIAAAHNSRLQQTDGHQTRSMTPKIEHQLREDALSIVEFLAEQHHPKAEFMKGMWLEFGKFGHRVDKKESFQSYRRSAERNFPRAQYRMGMQYESSNNSFKAIEHYNKGVAMKDSASNYRLGMMTLMGQLDTQQDFQRGVDLIRSAADTADENAPQGAYVYGMLLARELPNINIPEQYLPYDLNDAKLYIEKAAYLGFSKAQLKMAQAYELCQLGCEFEPALSLHYNALAARQGESEADMAISKWFLCGYESIFEKNEELAFTYAKRAAATKMATAEFAMGYFYEIGMYVPVDLRESEMWYQKAAEHGNKDALGRIDSIKKNHTFSKKDHDQVAISRIKSQYGSQRGARPDRFKQKGTPLPVIQDESVDVSEPRNSYNAPARPHSANPPPPRPVSVAPYPEDDMAFNSRGDRASSVSSFYGQGNLRPGPQADRPSSAFGIRPLTRTSGPNDPYSLSSPTEHVRPSSSQGNRFVPSGRGQNLPERERVPPAGWEPQPAQNYRQPQPISNQAPTLPQIEPTRPLGLGPGYHEPNRLQKPLPPNANKPQLQSQSLTGGRGYRGQAPLPQLRHDNPSTLHKDPATSQYRGSSLPTTGPVMNPQQQHTFRQPIPAQSPVSVASSQSRQGQRPPQHTMSSQGLRQDSHAPLSAHSAGPPTPLSAHSAHSVGSPAPSSAHSLGPSTPKPSAGPPKKQGPATFEEMGIPASKETNECVSCMIYH